MTNDTRETALHDAIMNLIRADLNAHTDYTSLSDLATYRLLNRIMRSASIELTAALDFPDNMPYYFSDSTFDDITAPTEIIYAANNALREMFDMTDVSDDIINALSELLTIVLPIIDDMIDDDSHLPANLAELIVLFND